MSRRLGLAIVALTLVGCGISREGARDETASRACKRYNECGVVGEGKRFSTSDACLVDQKAYWDDTWPASTCQSKINSTALDTCNKAIDITDCNNLVDLFNTAQKCSAAQVCSASTDGG